MAAREGDRKQGSEMRAIILTGFMGTGKSTIGRLLASRLGLPFVDLDARIEEREGLAVAEIFARFGEAYFRQREKEELAAALAEGGVVATGGGAILDAENLRAMRAAGPVICLTASLEVILQRTARGPERPLLAQADRRTRISELLQQRASAYAQADTWIDTSEKTPDEVVEEILAFLGVQAVSRGEPVP